MVNEHGRSARPAEICKALLAALQAAEGRRKRRKRDQTPDRIGLSIKQELLERVVQEDPDPEVFEEWLLNISLAHSNLETQGAVSAMARAIFEEWRLAHSLEDFRVWLAQGAPSDDADDNKPKSGPAEVRKT